MKFLESPWLDKSKKYKEELLEKAFCKQPYAYQPKVVKDLRDDSNVRTFPCPHKGCFCLIITNSININKIPTYSNSNINFNTPWKDKDLKSLKEQILYHCINYYFAQIPCCVAIKQRKKKEFSIPTSVDLIKLCTIKTFDQNDVANDLPNYKKYEKEDKTKYEETYKINYRMERDER